MLLPNGLYVVSRDARKYGVIKHYGILDVGNKIGNVNFSDSDIVVYHQIYPALKVERIRMLGDWSVLYKIQDELGAAGRLIQFVRNARYNMFTNNCEHFANYIATGEFASFQVRRAVIVTVVIGIIAAASNADRSPRHKKKRFSNSRTKRRIRTP